MKKENTLLRNYYFGLATAIIAFTFLAFKPGQQQKFGTIDVERINIVEKDGTVKMIITNMEHFPTKGDSVNNIDFHERKKRAGMLFFNDEGVECGGFIYDGAKNENGHSAGMSLTFDQYNGDQVMQLLTTDRQIGDQRYKTGGLVFNDRADGETQAGLRKIMAELDTISDREKRREVYNQYKEQGLIGTAPRVYLGQSGSKNNGLFLFDQEGRPRAMFYVNKENEAKLEILNEEGKVISSWPSEKDI